MQNDFPGDDPKTIWRNRPLKGSGMTLEKIRYKARELHAKTRRELFGNIAAAAIVVAISGPGVVRAQDLELRLMFAVAIAWALTGQNFLHRGMCP
jgi:hypothetical protein